MNPDGYSFDTRTSYERELDSQVVELKNKLIAIKVRKALKKKKWNKAFTLAAKLEW